MLPWKPENLELRTLRLYLTLKDWFFVKKSPSDWHKMGTQIFKGWSIFAYRFPNSFKESIRVGGWVSTKWPERIINREKNPSTKKSIYFCKKCNLTSKRAHLPGTWLNIDFPSELQLAIAIMLLLATCCYGKSEILSSDFLLCNIDEQRISIWITYFLLYYTIQSEFWSVRILVKSWTDRRTDRRIAIHVSPPCTHTGVLQNEASMQNSIQELSVSW